MVFYPTSSLHDVNYVYTGLNAPAMPVLGLSRSRQQRTNITSHNLSAIQCDSLQAQKVQFIPCGIYGSPKWDFIFSRLFLVAIDDIV